VGQERSSAELLYQSIAGNSKASTDPAIPKKTQKLGPLSPRFPLWTCGTTRAEEQGLFLNLKSRAAQLLRSVALAVPAANDAKAAPDNLDSSFASIQMPTLLMRMHIQAD
jgi:hypothetical protein